MANDLLNNLLLALLMNEVTGNADRVDASVNGNDVPVESGTIFGSNDGIKDGMQNFEEDTINRMARVDDGTFDLGSSSSFSVGAWFRQPANSNNPFIAKYDSSTPATNISWLMWQRTTNDRVRFSVSNDGSSVVEVEPATGTTPDNVWNFVTAGFDFPNQEIWIQINSVARNTLAHTTGIFQASVKLTIGWFQDVSKLMGTQDQDETYVWDRFITSDEHDTMYNGGTGLFFSSFEGGVADLSTISPLQIRRLIPAATSIPMIPKGQAGGLLNHGHLQHYVEGLEMETSSPCVATVLYRLIKEADDR